MVHQVSYTSLRRFIQRRNWRHNPRTVRMHGPEYLSDDVLLRRAIMREDELQRTVRELERNESELKLRASELERERDEVGEAAAASRQAHAEMEEAYRKERYAHGRTRRLAFRLSLVVAALVVICGLVTWRLVT